MAVDKNGNGRNGNGSSSNVAIVAIIVLVLIIVIGLFFYFGGFGKRTTIVDKDTTTEMLTPPATPDRTLPERQ